MLTSDSSRIEQSLRERLSRAFSAAGWEVGSPVDWSPAPDLLVSRGKHRYAVEFRATAVARRQSLQALLADGILRARALVRVRGEGWSPLAVVAAPNLTKATVETLREYARLVAPADAHGWIDGAGRIELVGPGLERIRDASERSAVVYARPQVSRVVHDPFTDLNQWLLKVLLAPRFPDEFVGGPRAPVRTASELASVADVSVPSAARFVAALEADHHLARDHELRLLRVPSLLEAWRGATRRPALELPTRWILKPRDPQKAISDLARGHVEHLERHVTVEEHEGFLEHSLQWGRGPRLCLGLFAACDALGLGFVRGVPRHIYVERWDAELLRKFGLAPAEGADRIDVVLRRPRFPEAVFRAAVRRDGVPVSDVLQAWLDVGDHPARGQEQAEHLWNNAIQNHVRKDEFA